MRWMEKITHTVTGMWRLRQFKIWDGKGRLLWITELHKQGEIF